MAKETNGGTWINVNSNEDKGHVNIYDNDPKGEHNSIHVNIDYKNESFSITEKDDSGNTPTNGSCFLTSACMKHLQTSFDDNCRELTILRWFRDNYVSKKDIEYYYQTAPSIVSAIDNTPNNKAIYDYIYENIVEYCVNAIENGDYDFAYDRYKNGILDLKENFAN